MNLNFFSIHHFYTGQEKNKKNKNQILNKKWKSQILNKNTNYYTAQDKTERTIMYIGRLSS